MSNPDVRRWPTKPVDQIVGPATYAAVQKLSSARACIVARGSVGLSGQIKGIRLTESRMFSRSQVDRLRDVLLAPVSYWIGSPIYRRFPPQPDFLIERLPLKSSLIVAVDLINPGWRIDCGWETYWAFHFAGNDLRAVAKELFPEFASPRQTSMWAKGSLPTRPYRKPN